MELVIPWINYWVCHHFGMSIDSDPATSSGPVMTLNIKWCSVINLFHWIHSRPQLWGRVMPAVIPLLSFSKKKMKMKVMKSHGSSGPNYREGSCPIFFWSRTEDPEKWCQFFNFIFNFSFWKKTNYRDGSCPFFIGLRLQWHLVSGPKIIFGLEILFSKLASLSHWRWQYCC